MDFTTVHLLGDSGGKMLCGRDSRKVHRFVATGKDVSKGTCGTCVKKYFKDIEGHKEFAARLVLMKNEAGQRGLYETMQALEAAEKKIGYEIAEMIKHAKGKR